MREPMPAHKKYFTIEEKKRADSKRHVYKKTSFTIENIKQNIKKEFEKQDDRINLIAGIWFVFDVLDMKKREDLSEEERKARHRIAVKKSMEKKKQSQAKENEKYLGK